MTEKPGSRDTERLILRWCKGERNAAGQNHDEAVRLIEDVASHVEMEKQLGAGYAHSIGILSPFRAQVDFIAEELAKRLPFEAFERHGILTGTAHTFQGEERDLMFISLAAGPRSHHATIRFLEKPDVFNVSITRARVGQYVYCSLDRSQLSPKSLTGAYLDYLERLGEDGSSATAGSNSDAFLREVITDLERLGYRVWPAYRFAGLIVDIVAARDQEAVGIDLVGHPGAFEQIIPLERYKMFHRAGFRVIPIPFSKWLFARTECLAAIEGAFGKQTSRI
jgi:hypothetical protein